ncbi:Rrf2 family transcriptional regulator [bacterium]|jgi:Rrf2 family protein|nr:Rrf2 family transcriptional regulator [bacterium]
MLLHTTTQYAIRVLVYISKNGKDKLYTAKELSDVLDIPYKFLTKIMTDLAKSNFINSIRGREGGYELSRPSSEITIFDIIESFKDVDDETKCILGIGKCDKNNKCVLHDECFIPRDSIREMYKSTTLDKFNNQTFKM